MGAWVFRIEISDDRAPERRRPDPVVAQAGVFAELAPEELSAVELARPEAAQAAAAKRSLRPARFWLAEDVLKYATRLYARFTNPFRKSGRKQ